MIKKKYLRPSSEHVWPKKLKNWSRTCDCVTFRSTCNLTSSSTETEAELSDWTCVTAGVSGSCKWSSVSIRGSALWAAVCAMSLRYHLNATLYRSADKTRTLTLNLKRVFKKVWPRQAEVSSLPRFLNWNLSTHTHTQKHTHTDSAWGLKGYWLPGWISQPIHCEYSELGFCALLLCRESAAWPTFILDTHTQTHAL